MSTATDPSIAKTIEQARSGDTGAFARIVRQFQSLVSGVLFSATGDFHQSEDLTQETFLIAWKKLDELRDADNLAAWLSTIARNLAHRSHRNKVVRTAHASLEQELKSPEPGPDAELFRREQSEFVWSALREIDEKYRETLVLYYRSGKSVREIAAAMDSTEDAVNQRLVRARKSLKVKLEQMIGDVLTDTAPGEAFTFGVMAALGASVFSMTAQTATAATTATAVGTGSATTGKAIGIGSLWMIFGPLLYFVWMFAAEFLSQWTVTQNTPTLRARRYRVYSFFLTCQYLLPFFGVMGVVSALLLSCFGDAATGPMASLVCSVPTMGCGLLIMYYFQRRVKAIIEDDLGLSEKHVSSYENRQIERLLHLSTWTNLFLLNGLMLTALTLQIIYEKLTGLSLFITLAVAVLFNLALYAYWLFGKHLLTLCRSPESMADFPPLIDNAVVVALGGIAQPSFAIDHRKEAGILRWGRILILLGLAGPIVWLITQLHWSRHPLATGLCVFGLAAGFGLTIFLRKRSKDMKTLHLIGAVLGVYQAGLALVLLAFECNFSFQEFCRNTVVVNPENMIQLPLFMFAVISLATSVVSAVCWLRLRFTNGSSG